MTAMDSVAPAAAEQQPIFRLDAERTPLEDAVASEYGEGFSSGGFLVIPSQLRGFVQTGAPAEAYRTIDFGTYK